MEDFMITIPIPNDVANFKLPDPDLLRYYRDYGDRVCYIDTDIDDDTFEITQRIFEWNRQDKGKKVEERKPIVMIINSYGGALDQAFALISAMRASKTPIKTVNASVAMSAGLLILLAGHERYAMKYSTAMIHPGSAVHSGNYEQMEESQKNYRKTVNMMKEFIIERTNIDPKELSRKWGKDWYVDSADQISLGICGKIVDNLDEVF